MVPTLFHPQCNIGISTTIIYKIFSIEFSKQDIGTAPILLHTESTLVKTIQNIILLKVE